jgi:hypothetical protein
MGAVEVNKLDYFNENFEEFFMKKVSSMSPQQINSLPIELKHKLFMGGLVRSSYKLRYSEKAYILSTTFNMNSVTIWMDENEGIGPDLFASAVAAQRGKIKNGEVLNNIPENNLFILGNRELMSPLIYLNHIFCSDIYKLISVPVIREKSLQERQHIKRAMEYRGLVDVFLHYESTKKLIAHEFKLDMPSWYALLYFANKERPARPFYLTDLKYAYSSSKAMLYNALNKLVETGYISQRGKRTELKCSLTAKGLDTLNQIIDRVILNYKKSA